MVPTSPAKNLTSGLGSDTLRRIIEESPIARPGTEIVQQAIGSAAIDPVSAAISSFHLAPASSVEAPIDFSSADHLTDASTTAFSTSLPAYVHTSELGSEGGIRTRADLSPGTDRIKQADGKGPAVRVSGGSLAGHDSAEIHPSDDPGEASINGAEALAHPLGDDEQSGRVEETPPSPPSQKPSEPMIYAPEPNRVVVQNPLGDNDHATTVGDSLTTQTSQTLQPSVAQPKLETPRISASAGSRSMRGAISTETGQRNHGGVAQSSAKAVEGLGELTDPGVARSIANQFGAKPAIRSGAPVESEVSKTFESLDAGVTVGPPAWVHTGERRAEAGFQDPTLGWIGVRANVDGTGIHAAIIPNSIDAAQELGGHLEGMNAYLATHHTSLESLTLGEPERHSSNSDMNGQAQHGTNHSGNQQSDQGADRDEASEQGIRNRNARFSLNPVDIAVRPAATGGQDIGIEIFTAPGAHVSVIA